MTKGGIVQDIRPPGSLVFAGGIGLAAYHAGAFEAFQEKYSPRSLAGSSAGAVTAALIAGNPPDRRLSALGTYWHAADLNLPQVRTQTFSWLSVIQARLFGRSGQFNPRPFVENAAHFRSVYELRPMRDQLRQLIDFERLNGGDTRICVATTDIETGEVVMFDTADGDRIEMDHILASCGFIPEFPAREIGGRLLGDGGLSMNAPFEPLLTESNDGPLFIVDLYARDGARPESLAAGVERRNDLIFSNQTFLRLQACLRDREPPRRPVFLLSYRSSDSEPGAEKMFDLSQAAIKERWAVGRLDMAEAIRTSVQAPGVLENIVPIRRKASSG